MRTGKRLGCKGSFLCMPSDDFLGLQPRSPSPRAFGSPSRARFGASPGSFLASLPRFRGGENRGGENRAPSGRSWREEDPGGGGRTASLVARHSQLYVSLDSRLDFWQVWFECNNPCRLPFLTVWV